MTYVAARDSSDGDGKVIYLLKGRCLDVHICVTIPHNSFPAISSPAVDITPLRPC